ncbi:S26 family signal peptidase [Mesorhizobium sp. YR577]|uniref:S26 family signal peptidase n=1 Tax=Mesorhizobium sp. YR577 TaxID=1884373 RepID=UPI0008EF80FD|nr:S26 family signal peptidase [Mesorhizobium sp. YR577]SFU22469.1 conjugative transfer signal peptidase TraF [Mesorhizobium sp. YR577]
MRRFCYIVTACFAIGGVAVAAVLPLPLKFIWNASASVPIGLYTIDAGKPPGVTDLVVVNAPEPLAAFLAERGYLPSGVPLMKRVAGVSGQPACRTGGTISVDGIEVAEALDHDRLGRALPRWEGCLIIAVGEVFLLNADVRESFDSRYLGPIPASSVIGRATALYTDEDGIGRFEWHAPTR